MAAADYRTGMTCCNENHCFHVVDYYAEQVMIGIVELTWIGCCSCYKVINVGTRDIDRKLQRALGQHQVP